MVSEPVVVTADQALRLVRQIDEAKIFILARGAVVGGVVFDAHVPTGSVGENAGLHDDVVVVVANRKKQAVLARIDSELHSKAPHRRARHHALFNAITRSD